MIVKIIKLLVMMKKRILMKKLFLKNMTVNDKDLIQNEGAKKWLLVE